MDLITSDHLRLMDQKSPSHLYSALYEGIEPQRAFYDIFSEALEFALCRGLIMFQGKYGHVTGYNKIEKKRRADQLRAINKTPLDNDIYKNVADINTNFKSANFRKLTGGSRIHHKDFTFDGVECRASFGAYNEEKNCLVFVAADAHAGKFQKNIFSDMIHCKAAFASRALGTNPTCYVVVVEKDAPFVSAFYKLSPETIMRGDEENIKSIQKFKEYQENGYPSYFEGMFEIV